MSFSDAQLNRYSRHILLPQIDIAGQQRISEAHVLIVGIGGLGSPAALYLAAAGVGQLTLADHDTVSLNNLQRQIVYDTSDVGTAKTAAAARRLGALNPTIVITTITEDTAVENAISKADIVLDCTDNFATRFAINRIAFASATPVVSGAAMRFAGQLNVFSMQANTPCYHCLFADTPDDTRRDCEDHGIFAPTVGIIGAMQAAEALKLICGIGESLVGRMLLIDVLSMTVRTVTVPQDPRCVVCGQS